MPISLTITADNADELRAHLAGLLGNNESPLIVQLATPTNEPAKRGRPPKATTEAAADTKPDESPKTEAGAAPAEATGSEVDYNAQTNANKGELTYEGHIKPAVLKVSAHPVDKGGGRDAVLALVAKYVDAADIPEGSTPNIKYARPEKWSALLADVAAIVGG